MKSFVSAALLLLVSIGASATDLTGYVSAGTQGTGLGIAMPVSASTNARVELNTINYSTDFTENSVSYSGKIKNNSIGAFVDWHLVDSLSNLRATAGAMVSDGGFNASGTTVNAGVYTFNNVNYPAAAGESVTMTSKFKKVAPYVGIGYGDMAKRTGVSFFADLGAFYAHPKTEVTLSPGLAAVVSPADLAAATATLQDKTDSLKWYPVLRVGVSYRF